jgi:EAL domain-containing protein (putative c-di-GMP-specific phosphodiesterase class I)
LTLEVTESLFAGDALLRSELLTELRGTGMKVAIDDFGTGYSSLAYLRQFPVDVLKIDRSFVADMSRSPDAAALIHTLIELGHTLGLVTLAEGIETHEQLEGLRAERCNLGQGFLFSGPVTALEMGDLLEIARAGKSITPVDAAASAAASARPVRPALRRTPSGTRPGVRPR